MAEARLIYGEISLYAICRALQAAHAHFWMHRSTLYADRIDAYLGCLFIVGPAHTLDILCHLSQHIACISTGQMRVLPEMHDIQTTRPSLPSSLSAALIT